MRTSASLERLTRILENFPEVDLAVLFGSAARGSQSAESDIDLGLRLTLEAPDLRRRIRNALGRALERDVDLVPLDASPPQLRFEIARDGIPLVERREHAWADFQARAMIDWWDWAPIARRIHAAAIHRLREKVARGSS